MASQGENAPRTDGTINPIALQMISVTTTWINAAFLIENASNNSHISLAAVYMHRLLNRKYKLDDTDFPVYTWELFLSLERQLSSNILKRNFFIIDAALLLNVLLSAIAVCSFYIAARQTNFHLSRLALAGFVFGIFCIAFAYHAHFSANTLWKALVTPEEAARFRTSV